MNVKRVYQAAANCATTLWEVTSVLARKGTHFWRMAATVLVSVHVLPIVPIINEPQFVAKKVKLSMRWPSLPDLLVSM